MHDGKHTSLIFGAAMLALTACGTYHPFEGPQITHQDRENKVMNVAYDAGGIIEAYVPQIEEMLAEGGWSARISTRTDNPAKCMSACTLYLVLDNVCTEPNAMFGFHGPSSNVGLPLSRERHKHYIDLLAPYYPEPLRTRFLNEWQHKSLLLGWVSGQWMIDNLDNVTECPE